MLDRSARDETLDPKDWESVAALARRIAEDAVAHVAGVRDRPVWQPMPQETRDIFSAPLPLGPMPLEDVYGIVRDHVMTYPMGNTHPRFWSWFMGSGSFTGALADFLAATQGSNVGGGDHAAALLDQQVVRWLAGMVRFPTGSSGTLTGGGSMANLLALTVARNAKAGIDLREEGLMALKKPMRFYASDEIHSCHQKAVEALGLGNKALRRVTSREDYTVDIAALRAAIAEDRANGFQPACVIGTAGTVNTGAVDDLNALADLAAEEGLWFHVDGCIGALMAIAPRNAWRVKGIERADSIALDPHKWLHAPFEVGCTLVRDQALHRATFAISPEYLKGSARGIAAAPWLFDYSLQASRGFSALKVWMSLMEHGAEKFGRLIDRNIDQAHLLASLIEDEPDLALLTPVEINIVCFRFDPGGQGEQALRALNIEIMLRMQEEGVIVLSDTTIRGRHCLRVAICNHRTCDEDLHLLVRTLTRIGRAVMGESSVSPVTT